MKYHVTLKICDKKIRIPNIEAPDASTAELIAITRAEKSLTVFGSEEVDPRACNIR